MDFFASESGYSMFGNSESSLIASYTWVKKILHSGESLENKKETTKVLKLEVFQAEVKRLFMII